VFAVAAVAEENIREDLTAGVVTTGRGC
jgi:hypothetical protein